MSKHDWKRATIVTSLPPQEVLQKLRDNSSNRGPAYSSAKFFGSVGDTSFSSTVAKSFFGIGPASPTVKGTVDPTQNGSIVRTQPALSWLSKSMVIAFLSIASLAILATALTVVSLRHWENEMLIGIGIGCFGLFGAMLFAWSGESLAAPSDWKRLQTLIADTVEGEITT